LGLRHFLLNGISIGAFADREDLAHDPVPFINEVLVEVRQFGGWDVVVVCIIAMPVFVK